MFNGGFGRDVCVHGFSVASEEAGTRGESELGDNIFEFK